MAMLLCQKCELQFDDSLRLPKVLPCGHMACLACLEECARTGCSMCPVCRKVFKTNIDELVTLQNPKANMLWCRDCEAEAKAACFEQHVLCGLGLMQRETAVELEAAWAGRAALLNTLAEDVRAEKQQLQQERDSGSQQQQQQLGLSALRGVLAAAKEHPLHGLPAGYDGVHAQGGLLRRALVSLRMEEELRAREAAVRDKEATVAEREAALDKGAPIRIRKPRLAAPGLQRGRNRVALSGRRRLESATAGQASSCSGDSSNISSEEGDNTEGQPVRRLPVRQPMPTNDSSTGSSDESIALEPALPRQAPGVASAATASQPALGGDCSFESADGSDGDEVSVGFGEATPSPSAPSGSDQEATGEKPGGLDVSFEASSSSLLDDASGRLSAASAVSVPVSSPGGQPCPCSSHSNDSSVANDESPAPTVPDMDSLPEELLQRILALVPLWWTAHSRRPPYVPDLLQLRLVCRRWARSVLSPTVWQHRELVYNDAGPAKPPYQLLRRVPVVSKLRCYVDSKRRDEVLPLMESPMRVRSLHLVVDVTNATCILGKRLLDKKHCEELDLKLLRRFPSMTRTTWLLEQVDCLKGLKALTLSYVACRHDTIKQGGLKHTFHQLTGLTKLSLGFGLHPDTVRSMLEASKLTLRELDCFDYDVAHLVATTASQLRCIRVAGDSISANLMHLRQLEHLEVADITLGYFTSGPAGTQSKEHDIVIGFLNSSPSVPREVHLTLKDFQGLHHWNSTEEMRRVSHLTIACSSHYTQNKNV